ncbi:multiple monosaccharide ABC transporter substrate-binding protein [Cellulomonas fimi]|uniref:Putative sugar ABC transporter, substrate-binding protein n=1 Tax=Cellulomonas fimi (strain ATCC 484 / DSM 20113 / JCM 1341 / CCUG 24087 / LMG 16345 / NBRC 15513 / NCIMB 8980 / NCTC 7547 / NRS-133) TaxID=590998 RepID=F4H604_CELFA|nr:multiple monosaccharide ABC transporter substrate-binding protein [Cellulomonas fimi]AEE46734.1 putative sugar ABC transporter, substrate-binding protein [Cellulomonas fimi ATCC 484]NNH07621.1 sugar ABC transporter substrate-binding protein [Cellulomonas fimi]VEH34024.1 Multiple sugar-binding periplasmic protein sbpA precursor [Cellulomonas fimi]
MSFAWRKVAVGIATAGLIVGLSACSQEREPAAGEETGGSSEGALIGIAMPTKSLERWNRDGAHLEELLQDAGYETTLQYADNKVDQQITQLQNMINQGAKVLVVASIDGTALAPVLEDAAAADIPVIAYDRLINDTENVDYYATFDNYKVGTLQGEFIEEALDLQNAAGPFNLEPFAGSPDDNNAKFFFSGAWDVLKPYVDEGKLVVPSGKAPASNDDWQSIGIQGWGSDTAQAEMENRLNSFYGGGQKVQVVLSPNDSLALGIAQALEGAGYAPGDGYPVLTGQDADQAYVLNMIAGKQSMSVWKDTRALGDQVAKMVDQIVKGETVDVNDEETYDNGVKVVPTYLLDPQVVTPDTVESVLVESGFYTAEDLGL